ncbi:MAG: hypothetical protein AAB906_00155 [Patescibacteria group bacterium]
MDNIIITNQEKLDAVKARIIADGPEKLHVVSDFDKTLTSCFVNGAKIASLISILRDENYLTPDYPEKAKALFEKYHPIEIDPSVSLEKKKRWMHEWWNAHFELLIKSKLNKKDLEKIINSENISLRPGVLELLDSLKANNIPLIIISAAGLGTESISLYLNKFNRLHNNIHIDSNAFIWNDSGHATSIEEPIVHVFNKDYSSVKAHSFYEQVKDRKNVLLLGDSEGDASMIDGFDCENVIKIGFLNEISENGDSLELFKKNFDVIILNDGPMDFVNDLLKEVVK